MKPNLEIARDPEEGDLVEGIVAVEEEEVDLVEGIVAVEEEVDLVEGIVVEEEGIVVAEDSNQAFLHKVCYFFLTLSNFFLHYL
jgi:hypothetical protein